MRACRADGRKSVRKCGVVRAVRHPTNRKHFDFGSHLQLSSAGEMQKILRE